MHSNAINFIIIYFDNFCDSTFNYFFTFVYTDSIRKTNQNYNPCVVNINFSMVKH